MKGTQDWEVLRDFYLYSDLNDEHAIDEYLEEKNIDIDESAIELQEFLRSKKAELELARGRKFKEAYLKALSENIADKVEHETEEQIHDFSFAYRKNDDGDDDIKNMTDDEKKLQIIKKLTEKKEQKNNHKES